MQNVFEPTPIAKKRLRTMFMLEYTGNFPLINSEELLFFFTIKNRLGNAIAIKQQFKHLYLQMSEWYCEGGIPSRLDEVEADQELQKMIDTIGNEQITKKYWSWFHGT